VTPAHLVALRREAEAWQLRTLGRSSGIEMAAVWWTSVMLLCAVATGLEGFPGRSDPHGGGVLGPVLENSSLARPLMRAEQKSPADVQPQLNLADEGDAAASPAPPPPASPRMIGALDDTQTGKIKVGSTVKSNWSCDHYKALKSEAPCKLKDTHGQSVINCVSTMLECATLATADDTCSNLITYYGDKTHGPGGEYPGKCLCVTKGQDCGGWKAKGATVAKVVTVKGF